MALEKLKECCHTAEPSFDNFFGEPCVTTSHLRDASAGKAVSAFDPSPCSDQVPCFASELEREVAELMKEAQRDVHGELHYGSSAMDSTFIGESSATSPKEEVGFSGTDDPSLQDGRDADAGGGPLHLVGPASRHPQQVADCHQPGSWHCGGNASWCSQGDHQKAVFTRHSLLGGYHPQDVCGLSESEDEAGTGQAVSGDPSGGVLSGGHSHNRVHSACCQQQLPGDMCNCTAAQDERGGEVDSALNMGVAGDTSALPPFQLPPAHSSALAPFKPIAALAVPGAAAPHASPGHAFWVPSQALVNGRGLHGPLVAPAKVTASAGSSAGILKAASYASLAGNALGCGPSATSSMQPTVQLPMMLRQLHVPRHLPDQQDPVLEPCLSLPSSPTAHAPVVPPAPVLRAIRACTDATNLASSGGGLPATMPVLDMGMAAKPQRTTKGNRMVASAAAAVVDPALSPRGARKRAAGRIAANPTGHSCTQCGTQSTPVWRAGPAGPKTLCNACGVRFMKKAKK